jgi:hypothetical protein
MELEPTLSEAELAELEAALGTTLAGTPLCGLRGAGFLAGRDLLGALRLRDAGDSGGARGPRRYARPVGCISRCGAAAAWALTWLYQSGLS